MPQTILDEPFETAQVGPWLITNNTWGAGPLQFGSDYTQTVTYDPDTGPAGTRFDFAWPAADTWRVYGYPELATGWNPWIEQGGDALTTRADNLRSLTVDYDVTLAGDTDSYNIAIDMWLTDRPNGDRGDITTEVLITLHEPLPGAPDDAPVYTDPGGFRGRLAVYEGLTSGNVTWDLVAIEALNSVPAGSIDLGALMRWLIGQGVVNAADHVGGFEFGAEVYAVPQGSSGSVTVNALDFDFVRGMVQRGTDGDDRLRGRADGDDLEGKGGNDRLAGGDGDDTLAGGAGDDVLRGGAGRDFLRGGSGADVFRFATGDATGGDTVAGFDADDMIDLRGYVGLRLVAAPDGAGPAVWIDGATLRIDTDGDGLADETIVVHGATPAAADLLI
jgi:Ca2+-binding RTX toxin-like protein